MYLVILLIYYIHGVLMINNKNGIFSKAILGLTLGGLSLVAHADVGSTCSSLPKSIQDDLKRALVAAVAKDTTGLNLNMWATIVDRDGTACAVVSSGQQGDQWPLSRIISAQKANTANSLSLGPVTSNGKGPSTGLALSTANLYSAVQPGGSLFGLPESNPVDPSVAYKGPSSLWGTSKDPIINKRTGGVNVFGGGLALYDEKHQVVGGVGVSGDTSCRDHRVAWLVRNNLGLDHLAGVGGVSGDSERPDNMIFDITPNPAGGSGVSASGFGHPSCLGASVDGNPKDLPAVSK